MGKAMVKDVVCGMMIDPEKAPEKRTVEGQKFYFCSAGCAKRFDAAPNRVVSQPLTGQHH